MIMTCGCAAQSKRSDGARICGVHYLATSMEPQPNLEGRTAVCSYESHKPIASSPTLAFFKYRVNKDKDEYYCGCYGWN